MLKKITLFTATAISAFAMNTAEVNINNKDLEVSAKFDIGQFNDAVEPDTMFLGGKFLNADRDHADTTSAKFDPFYEANFLMMRKVGDQGIKLGMGLKLNHTKSYTTVPLGLQFSYKIPAVEYIPMHLNGELYYAPSVLSYENADSFLEYRVSYDIQVIKNGNVTLGYRKIETNYESNQGYAPQGGDFTYNSSWYIGFKIGF